MSIELPIIQSLSKIKSILHVENTLILQAPPGAGKSTVLPLELLKEEWLVGKKILMLEPRKLAARSVATRMASLIGEEVGQTVGFRVRFENKTSSSTRLEVLTEGILTRMLQQDSSLEGVGMVIFDEFHERSLHADLALTLCREIQQVIREDLKILIMSATLDGEHLLKLLGNAKIVTSLGRQHPIQHVYLGNDNAPIYQRMSVAIRKALKEETGDILAFLPGASEIHRTFELLSFDPFSKEYALVTLYGDLSPKEQQAAILPHPDGKRKVVLSTSIAETSLTIEGVKIVIDSGLARVPTFDPSSGFTKLETFKVTLDAADQRAGRAGRLGPEICYRLWSEGTHNQLVAQRTPEILEADLASMMLELAKWGITDINSLTWPTMPPNGAVNQARELLNKLGALDNFRITKRGIEMLQLPTHPRIAHLLLEGQRLGLLKLAIDVASVLEERDPMPKETSANLATRIEALDKFRNNEYVSAERSILERINRNSIQLLNSCRQLDNMKITNDKDSFLHEQVGLLIALAFPERIAKQKDNDLQRYRLANGRNAKLVSEYDPLDREKWLAIAHLDAGFSNEGRIFLAAPLNPDQLSHLLTITETVRWDSQKGILLAQNELRLGDIIVKTSPIENVSEQKKNEVLYQVVRSEGLGILAWTEEAKQFQNRIIWLNKIREEENFPMFDDENLVENLENWLFPLHLIRKRDDFQKLDVLSLLKNQLSWESAQRIETLAPEKISVPSGFMVPLQYFSDGRDPVLAVRLQEMFGLIDTPTINEGRTKVLLHLLSPGYKPVQVTQDLKSFWKNTYPDVRKELRIRYQKHHWPEDPWTAEAVRGVKKNLTRTIG